MNLPEFSGAELKGCFDQLDFIEATTSQINKDLMGLLHSEFYVNFHADSTPLQTLINALIPVLQELSKRQSEQLSQFIYRVDLREDKFLNAVSQDTTFKQLAFLIIEREAQKVYLRKRLS